MSASALLCVALGAGAGALVQGVYGFGFALVAAPLLAAVLRPEEAVALLAVASVALSGTVLATTPRTRSEGPVLRQVLPWAVAGVPVGALLWRLPDDPLRVAVCVVAFLAAVALLRDPGAGRVPLRGAGALAGVLTTATGTNGPPLVLAFARARLPPAAMRRALAGCFLVLDVPAIALVLAAGKGLPAATALVVASLAAAGGVVLARPLRGRVPEARFHRDVLLLVAISSLAGLAVVLG